MEPDDKPLVRFTVLTWAAHDLMLPEGSTEAEILAAYYAKTDPPRSSGVEAITDDNGDTLYSYADDI